MGRATRTDSELIAASRGGDRAAFGEIVERYQRAVDAVSYSGTRDRSLAEDVMQDTFITAWRQLSSLRDVERLPAWLCGIARKLAVRARDKRNRETVLDDHHVAGGGTSYEQLSEREDEHVVATSLAKVPETYREALVLFYCEQQSVKAVAQALGISENATHQRLARGRQQLADHVGVVERSLERRRPRAGLVAAVLAAIAIGSSSQVEASPSKKRTQGSTMLKFGIAAALLTAVAGTGYVVARSNTESATASTTATTPSPATAGSSATTTHSATSTTPAGSTRKANGSSSTADSDPVSCASVAHHLGMMTVLTDSENQEIMAQRGGPEHVERSAKPFADSYLADCTELSWSLAIRTCIASVDDFVGFQTKCGAPPTRGVVREGTTVIQDTEERPAYTGSDQSCESVGLHMVALQRPTEKTLERFAPAQRPEMRRALEEMLVGVPESVETNCESAPWSLAVRRCMLASATYNQALACSVAK